MRHDTTARAQILPEDDQVIDAVGRVGGRRQPLRRRGWAGRHGQHGRRLIILELADRPTKDKTEEGHTDRPSRMNRKRDYCIAPRKHAKNCC